MSNRKIMKILVSVNSQAHLFEVNCYLISEMAEPLVLNRIMAGLHWCCRTSEREGKHNDGDISIALKSVKCKHALPGNVIRLNEEVKRNIILQHINSISCQHKYVHHIIFCMIITTYTLIILSIGSEISKLFWG